MDNIKFTAGLILLEEPITPILATKSWIVGIDFKLTETCIFAGEFGYEPSFVVFRERLRQVTAPGAARVNYINTSYRMIGNQLLLFLNIFHDFQIELPHKNF